MATSLATYISLPGNAAEAFQHWHSVFGGSLELMKYGDANLPDMPDEPPADAVAHAVLHTPGGDIAGGDAMEEGYAVRDTAYSLLYSVDTPEEARDLIEKLIDGGGARGCPSIGLPGAAGTGRSSTDSASCCRSPPRTPRPEN